MKEEVLVPNETIESKIYLIRGQKVMMDHDLADLYGVPTGNLNRQVRRNADRFPEDFMFQLSKKELDNLICQFGTSRSKWGGMRKLPYAFTEQGIAMLSSVLRSKRAVRVNIIIMRAFVKIRYFLYTHKDLSDKLDKLEQKVSGHDAEIKAIFDAIRQLMLPPAKETKKIGFLREKE